MKKLTQVFVAAAAAICLLLGIASSRCRVSATETDNSVVRGNYVDVLADAKSGRESRSRRDR